MFPHVCRRGPRYSVVVLANNAVSPARHEALPWTPCQAGTAIQGSRLSPPLSIALSRRMIRRSAQLADVCCLHDAVHQSVPKSPRLDIANSRPNDRAHFRSRWNHEGIENPGARRNTAVLRSRVVLALANTSRTSYACLSIMLRTSAIL